MGHPKVGGGLIPTLAAALRASVKMGHPGLGWECSRNVGSKRWLDGGGREGGGSGGCGEVVERLLELAAEGIEMDAAKRRWVGAEAAQGAGEQRDGSGRVAALEVVEGGGDLDQPLQKVFLGLREGEPDGFPVFVGEKELAAAVAGEAIGEGSASPIEGHGTIIVDGARDGAGVTIVIAPCVLRLSTLRRNGGAASPHLHSEF